MRARFLIEIPKSPTTGKFPDNREIAERLFFSNGFNRSSDNIEDFDPTKYSAEAEKYINSIPEAMRPSPDDIIFLDGSEAINVFFL